MTAAEQRRAHGVVEGQAIERLAQGQVQEGVDRREQSHQEAFLAHRTAIPVRHDALAEAGPHQRGHHQLGRPVLAQGGDGHDRRPLPDAAVPEQQEGVPYGIDRTSLAPGRPAQVGEELEGDAHVLTDDLLEVPMVRIGAVRLVQEPEEVLLHRGNGSPGDDVGSREEVALEELVAVGVCLPEFRVGFHLLGEEAYAASPKRARDLAPRGPVGEPEVHLDDIGEVHEHAGQVGGDHVVEGHRVAGRLQAAACLA